MVEEPVAIIIYFGLKSIEVIAFDDFDFSCVENLPLILFQTETQPSDVPPKTNCVSGVNVALRGSLSTFLRSEKNK